ncbi:DUF2777 family protein [Salisediminibacterium beveridgei]|uniref:Uncharacterized protein n=1 Tax=Salisediminibacterium beveridgei TaxID=632773 RepID=A0A1D7QV34_9BACI|nr:DUF2777 family protein [Salisediminibacterium beveridgei]AOM82857.1 hypothetical protein BBEV_1494 [Salisediminibacterium beveridgei]
MNKKEAKNLLKQRVILNEGSKGTYSGILEKIEPRENQPWIGHLAIKTVETYPDISTFKRIGEPLYRENEMAEVSGTKITMIPEDFNASRSYNESLLNAVDALYDHLKSRQLFFGRLMEELSSRYDQLEVTRPFEDRDAVHNFVLKEKNGHHGLVHSTTNEFIHLKNSFFEFLIPKRDRDIPAMHEDGFTFKTHEGDYISLKEGATVRIKDDQFNLYVLFRNELDPLAKKALEKALSSLQIKHSDIEMPDNTMLGMVDMNDRKKEFTGTSFYKFISHNKLAVLQHFYERKEQNGSPSFAYDRFELTDNNGGRIVTIYSSEAHSDSFRT